jgi:hypothetical protein
MSTLYLEYWLEDEDFYFSVWDDATLEDTYAIEGDASSILALFDTVYTILNDREVHRTKALESALNELSEYLIEPLADILGQYDLIRLVVPEDLLRCPFDLLIHNGLPLFVNYKICYQLVRGGVNDEPSIALESGLLISDPENDPDNVCVQLAEFFDEGEYVEISEANLDLIEENADALDVLVISATGTIDEDGNGTIDINGEEFGSDEMGQLEQWLIVIDSAMQGVNVELLQAFQEQSNSEYYFAPIFNNDAGDATTRALQAFFTQLSKHQDPIRAAFITRKNLLAHYSNDEELGLIGSLAKAAAFRLYERADSSDE